MLIILGVILLISIFITLGMVFDIDLCFATAFTIGFISIIIIPIIIFGSYFSYLHDRSFYDVTVTQYRDQITMYKTEAMIDVKGVYTDVRYIGYQKEMASNIRELTNNVVEYNKSIIEKRILKKNIVFSWLITKPDDDMKTISLYDKKK